MFVGHPQKQMTHSSSIQLSIQVAGEALRGSGWVAVAASVKDATGLIGSTGCSSAIHQCCSTLKGVVSMFIMAGYSFFSHNSISLNRTARDQHDSLNR